MNPQHWPGLIPLLVSFLSFFNTDQDQLAAARGAITTAEAKLVEEQESRREFLRQFQARSKAALAERVELEQQVRACETQSRQDTSRASGWSLMNSLLHVSPIFNRNEETET